MFQQPPSECGHAQPWFEIGRIREVFFLKDDLKKKSNQVQKFACLRENEKDKEMSLSSRQVVTQFSQMFHDLRVKIKRPNSAC